jgi:hypothetical protein
MIAIHEIGGEDTNEGKYICEIIVEKLKSLKIPAIYARIGDELNYDASIGIHARISDGYYQVEITSLNYDNYAGNYKISEKELSAWIENCLKYLISIGSIREV